MRCAFGWHGALSWPLTLSIANGKRITTVICQRCTRLLEYDWEAMRLKGRAAWLSRWISL